jgi:hypothetical protein
MIKFDHDDNGYFRWLWEHKDGFALGMGRHPHEGAPGYFATIHRARCSVNERTHTNTYPKWCSDNVNELIVTARRQEGPHYPVSCKICHPF